MMNQCKLCFVLGEEGFELTGILLKKPDSMGVSSLSSISGKGELSRADSKFDSTSVTVQLSRQIELLQIFLICTGQILKWERERANIII